MSFREWLDGEVGSKARRLPPVPPRRVSPVSVSVKRESRRVLWGWLKVAIAVPFVAVVLVSAIQYYSQARGAAPVDVADECRRGVAQFGDDVVQECIGFGGAEAHKAVLKKRIELTQEELAVALARRKELYAKMCHDFGRQEYCR